MIHCHNLVHEDHDMVARFEVVDPNMDGDHPLGTPATWLVNETPR